MAFTHRLRLKSFKYLFLSLRNSSFNSSGGRSDRFEFFFQRMSPFLDLDERLNDVPSLSNSLNKRCMREDVSELKMLWQEYNSLLALRDELATKREILSNSLKSKDKTSSEIPDLRTLGKSLREEFKKASKQITDIERTLIPRILSLPNELISEEKTESMIFNSVNPYTTDIDHLSCGEKLGYLEFIDPFTYFLFDKAAEYDLRLTSFLLSFMEQHGFMKVSNPDFSRTLLLGGLGVSETCELINLDDSTTKNELDVLYLNGGAHVLPFCALHAKTVTSVLPVKYVALGRSYSTPQSKLHGLYSVWQSSSVNFFLATSESNYLEELSKVAHTLSEAYTFLGIKHRTVASPVEALNRAEAGRLTFQVYSPYHQQYVDVAELSAYKQYISQRLNMYYQNQSDQGFLHVVSGSLCRIPPLLATILEHHPDTVKQLLNKQLAQITSPLENVTH